LKISGDVWARFKGTKRTLALEHNNRRRDRCAEFHFGKEMSKDFPKLFQPDGYLLDVFLAPVANKEKVLRLNTYPVVPGNGVAGLKENGNE